MLARVRTPSSQVREREKEKEGEKKRKRVRKRERERESIYILKGMTGALAPFSNLVHNNVLLVGNLLAMGKHTAVY